jgi:SPP1 gp7 family putative phage head morphogenesis protein
MESEMTAYLAAAIARGVAATDRLAAAVLDLAARPDDLAAVAAVCEDPEAIPQTALAPLLAALSSAMLTGDLIGRYHVARELAAAKIPVAPIAHAFPGQAGGVRYAELGTLDVEPLPPAEAIDYFRTKVPMQKTAFEELSDIYRGRAFTIARQVGQRSVSIVQDLLTDILRTGGTLADFREGLAEAAAAGGIRTVNPYHAATVFQTNVQTAYNAGRYDLYTASEVADAFPYFQYHTVGDDRVRPSHAQMDGYLARRDAPVWDLWWPPNGFNCRCTVTAVSAPEAEAGKMKPSRRQVPNPDDGFAGNPAQAIRTTGV